MELTQLVIRYRNVAASSALLSVLVFASWGIAEAQIQPSQSTAETLFSTAPAENQDPGPTESSDLVIPARRLSFGDRVHLYQRSITSYETVLDPLLGAAVNQARNEPPEWGQGDDAFAVLLASGYARSIISRTIRFGVAAVDHEDPRFYPSDEKGFWHRAKTGVIHVFVARTDAGTQVPAFSRFAGIYGAAFISNAWYPARRANASHALLRGTTAFSATVAWNVSREFWPDIKEHVFH